MADEKEQIEQGQTKDNPDVGAEDKTPKTPGENLVEQARSERELLAKENERLETNLKELRELEAQRQLSGTAGGRVEPTPAKEETALEYSKRVMSGGLNEKAKEE